MFLLVLYIPIGLSLVVHCRSRFPPKPRFKPTSLHLYSTNRPLQAEPGPPSVQAALGKHTELCSFETKQERGWVQKEPTLTLAPVHLH